MKRKTITRLALTGLVALASSVPVFGDVGGSSYRGMQEEVEDAARLVDNIQNADVRKKVLLQLFDKGVLKDSDPILPEVLDLLQEKKNFKKAAYLAKDLGEDVRAGSLFAQWMSERIAGISEKEDKAREYASIGHAARNFGLEKPAKAMYRRAIDISIMEGNFEAAAGMVSNEFGNVKRANVLYQRALNKALKTEPIWDDVRILEKMGDFTRADGIYSTEIARREEECDFYDVGHLYERRARLADKRGNEELSKEFIEKARAFETLRRYGIKCNSNAP